MAPPMEIKKNRYLVHVTCPFDLISVLFTIAYTSVLPYRHFVGTN